MIKQRGEIEWRRDCNWGVGMETKGFGRSQKINLVFAILIINNKRDDLMA